ncbi:phosphatase PAP2 family protein [Leptospira sp. 201903070]|uniref:Phosphatase PAP2 family protein n=1 Tax=Leptospira ainlahdjerensis TaxID=2810033 RepID=A0ABS2UHU4_9LEPT|nr:phosphatase PAP2 family protein [Leptospira ainlahdjerensis]MBM9578867.1 phosphatase PAP2 family protein [Leptospira ainlahdjerensis]
MSWFQDSFWFGNGFLETLRGAGASLAPTLGWVSLLFHHLGGNLFFMILLSSVYIFWDRKLGIRLGVGLLTSGIVNGLAKAYFESPRPLLAWIGPGSLTEFAYGFPSGHVQTSVVIWGLLLLNSKSKPLQWLSGIVILLMPFSRMYAGVHFPGDVLGGFVLGLLGLLSVQLLFRMVPELEAPRPFPGQNLSNTKTLSLIIVVVTLPSVLLYSEKNGIEKVKSYEQVISACGALAGFAIGILISKYHSLDWKPMKTWNETGKRTGILIVGVLLFYFLPGVLVQKFLPENPVARYLRYGIVSSYIGFFSVYLLALWREKTDFKK